MTKMRLAAALVFTLGCSDANDADGGASSAGTEPVYALNVIVFDPSFEATTYVALSPSLSFGADPLEHAREFPGFQSIAAAGGKLLVSMEESITQYSLSDDLTWQDGASLGFAEYGITQAGFHDQFFLDERTAYASSGHLNRVVWNPVELAITEFKEDSSISPEPEDGLELQAAFNRTSWIPRSGPVMRPFYYRDENWFEFSPTSRIAVYDETTHEEQVVVDAPCSALENATQDEAGNTYFSTWNVRPTRFLYGLAPEPCLVRITPDGQLDDGFAPPVSEWAGGRPSMVMRYLAEGKAVASFFHTEEIEADWSAEYDPDVNDEVTLGTHFHLWFLDFDAQSAHELGGVIAMDGQFHGRTIDGRHFVFLPYDGYARTKIYEVLLDGSAVEHLDTAGWVYDLVRVR